MLADADVRAVSYGHACCLGTSGFVASEGNVERSRAARQHAWYRKHVLGVSSDFKSRAYASQADDRGSSRQVFRSRSGSLILTLAVDRGILFRL